MLLKKSKSFVINSFFVFLKLCSEYALLDNVQRWGESKSNFRLDRS